MPLLDHFHPPVADLVPGESLHSSWATRLADALNENWWTEHTAVGEPLPTLPLRLTGDLFVPVEFETTYLETCRRRRII